jgi:hypothetical protein
MVATRPSKSMRRESSTFPATGPTAPHSKHRDSCPPSTRTATMGVMLTSVCLHRFEGSFMPDATM